MPALAEIVSYLDRELQSSAIPDYDAALNGLHLANSGTVTRVAAAVDYSALSIAGAIREGANLLVVHHGMFWRGAHPFVGPAYDRLRSAVSGDLAIYSSHIPLDLHPVHGNNVLLAQELRLQSDASFGGFRGVEIGVTGATDTATATIIDRVRAFSARFDTTTVVTPFDPARRTRRWAIVTGAGISADTLAQARARHVDTFIVGEGTHHTAVEAMESDIVVAYAGHYATETLGVQAIAREIGNRFDVSTTFVNVPTGL